MTASRSPGSDERCVRISADDGRRRSQRSRKASCGQPIRSEPGEPVPEIDKTLAVVLTRARPVQDRLPLSLPSIRPYVHIPFPLRGNSGGGSQREARAAVPAWTRRAPMQFRTVNHGFTNFVAFPSLPLSLSLLAFLLFPCPHTEKASPRCTRREPRPSLTRCSQLACNP